MIHSDDKTTWGDGPWQSEPDEKRWADPATGYECFAMRGPVGSWCGYVGVREGHPAFGLSYYKGQIDIDDLKDGMPAWLPVQKKIDDIRVHGGLTYSGSSAPRPEGFHWFGFDCGHADDYSPKFDRLTDPVLGLGCSTGWGSVIEYRDLAFVEKECARLAAQLSDVAGDKFTNATRAVASAIETRRAETREAGLGAKPESAAPEGGDAP